MFTLYLLSAGCTTAEVTTEDKSLPLGLTIGHYELGILGLSRLASKRHNISRFKSNRQSL